MIEPRPSPRTRPLALVLALAALGAVTADGPLVLFDGKTLDGWKKTEFSRAGAVSVADGAIVMEAGPAMTGVTSTRNDLPKTDYELSYQAKRLAGVDFFAAATFPVAESHATFVNGGWGGHVTGISSLDGADASENDTNSAFPYKNDTWYRFRVRVTRAKIQCWVDDKRVVDVSIADREVGTRIESHRSKPLGFATWASKGAVRAIEVRRLTAAEVAEAAKDQD